MASTFVPDVELYTEVIQIIRGGEPDENGISLAGRISPLAPSYNTQTCACSCVAIGHSFWERLDRLNPYRKDSDIWMRVLLEGDDEGGLPEGASVVETRRVSYRVR
ncbi:MULTISPECIES: hypothetical protein [Nocardiopsis]|uniref:Uncharacterized protein n=1 Tax=Nocardiopsis eucommiae TaxID=2831970 RepID=A0A975LAI0_9ACTN|nr:hypothetical protein [Nocardiopsis prasina]QVJ02141.1 hypothetical protein KGD82_04870 [Nocardiopsis eucommiae]